MVNVKKSLPRKKRAIRRWMIAVIMLLLIVLLSPRCFTVEQSLRNAEKYYGTGETELIYKFPQTTSFLKENKALTISKNDGVFMCLYHGFNLRYGWRASGGNIVDVSDDYLRRMNCGQAIISFRKTNEGIKSMVFGAVYDDRISRIVITGSYLTANPSLLQEMTQEEFTKNYLVTYEIVVDDFWYSNGVREFFAEYSDDRSPYSWSNVGYIAYDENGNYIINDKVIPFYFHL